MTFWIEVSATLDGLHWSVFRLSIWRLYSFELHALIVVQSWHSPREVFEVVVKVRYTSGEYESWPYVVVVQQLSGRIYQVDDVRPNSYLLHTGARDSAAGHHVNIRFCENVVERKEESVKDSCRVGVQIVFPLCRLSRYDILFTLRRHNV